MKIKGFYRQLYSKPQKPSTKGFTVLELLVTVAMIGIVSAIAAPSWLAFINNQSLIATQDQVQRSLHDAKRSAKQNKATWQVSFREHNGTGQWVVHPRNVNTNTLSWRNFDSRVSIDANETTFLESGGVWRIQFNYRGHVNGQLGRLTLVLRQGGKAKRCVITSTLIGAIRTAKERPTQQDGKFCY
ncbi:MULTISPECIES: type II secretion system protein [Trichocoleus]|uniref:Type II secretion system GspH family protein n=1 Tax=Trichocoleus desertorum GB2-A4 TaxID=2933944 RepID=A0ABV0J4Y8_9CYAN|nr:type II secretion system protein [Trichocoleus sp. FACHB-46]